MYNTFSEIKEKSGYWLEKYEELKAMPDEDYDPERESDTKEGSLKVYKHLHEGKLLSIKNIELVLDMINNQGWTLDLRGHWLSTKDLEKMIVYYFNDACSSGYHQKCLKDETKDRIQVGKHNDSYKCYKCGKGHLDLYINRAEKKFEIHHTTLGRGSGFGVEWGDCMYIDGFGPYSVEIDIPSGHMLFSNHFRKLYDWTTIEGNEDKRWSDEFSINQLHGRKRTSEETAKLNCAELNIGNCSCIMYQNANDEDKFIVGDYGEIEEKLEDGTWNYRYPFEEAGYKEVGNICCDYWGYCVVDKKDFLNKTSKKDLVKRRVEKGVVHYNSESLDTDIVQVKCKAGRYRFTHRYHLCHDDKDGQIYTHIERIGDCS